MTDIIPCGEVSILGCLRAGLVLKVIGGGRLKRHRSETEYYCDGAIRDIPVF